MEHTEATHNKIKTTALEEMGNRKSKKKSETNDDRVSRDLSRTILENKNDLAMEQHSISKDFWCMEVGLGDDNFQTLEDGDRIFLCRSNQVPLEKKHRRSIYARTRMLILREIEVDGKNYVVVMCSCGFFYHELCACRHVYSLLNRYPVPSDFFPCCFKTYEISYLTDMNYTKRCDAITEQMQQNSGILISTKMIDINPRHGSNNQLSWYMECYNQVKDVNQNSLGYYNKVPGGDDFEFGSADYTPFNPEEPQALTRNRESKGKMSAHNRHHPAYSLIMDQVKTEEQHEFVENAMKDMLQNVMTMGRPKAPPSNKKRKCDDNLQSLPVVDTSAKKKRQAPFGSPSKFKSG